MAPHETIVISVGGSLIVPDQIDISFLSALKKLIVRETDPPNSRRFVIICGGGKTCRKYQAAGAATAPLSKEELDWIGTHTNTFNAQFMRIIFQDVAHQSVITDPTTIPESDKPVLFVGGWQPGGSSDLVAVVAAQTLGAKKIINLSNVDYVYTDDPNKNLSAEKIEEISWSDFRKLIPAEWDPGLSSPFDPVAAREAERLGIEVAIIHGNKLAELENYLEGRPFVGTRIF